MYSVNHFNTVAEFKSNFPNLDLDTNFFSACFGSRYKIRNINQNDTFFFAHDSNNQVVGFLTVDDKNKSNDDFFYIWNVCVNPQNRGQGITKLMFTYLIKKYINFHRKFCLNVEWGNSIAVISYTSEFFCDWLIRDGKFFMYGEIGNQCPTDVRKKIQNDFEKLSRHFLNQKITLESTNDLQFILPFIAVVGLSSFLFFLFTIL